MELVDGEVQALGCIEYKVTRDNLDRYIRYSDMYKVVRDYIIC